MSDQGVHVDLVVQRRPGWSRVGRTVTVGPMTALCGVIVDSITVRPDVDMTCEVTQWLDHISLTRMVPSQAPGSTVSNAQALPPLQQTS